MDWINNTIAYMYLFLVRALYVLMVYCVIIARGCQNIARRYERIFWNFGGSKVSDEFWECEHL